MRVAIVSTYRPRPCGIAVFSPDLRRRSWRPTPRSRSRSSPSSAMIPTGAHRRSSRRSARTCRRLRRGSRGTRRRGTDVVLIEHEYGIFGGDAGEYVLTLAESCTCRWWSRCIPCCRARQPQAEATLRALCRRATLVMVFTETARRMVVEHGRASSSASRVVPHGAPDVLTRPTWPDRAGRGHDRIILGSVCRASPVVRCCRRSG